MFFFLQNNTVDFNFFAEHLTGLPAHTSSVGTAMGSLVQHSPNARQSKKVLIPSMSVYTTIIGHVLL